MTNKRVFLGLSIILLAGLTVWMGCDLSMNAGLTGGSDARGLSLAAAGSSSLVPEGQTAVVGEPNRFPLYAGQNIPAGEVTVTINGDYLLVNYATANGFTLSEAHLWAGSDLALMPAAKNGNPKIGLFPYKAENLGGLTSYVFSIPLASLVNDGVICGKSFFAAAHAVVSRELSGGGVQTETAWAGTTRIVSKGSWATFFTFSIVCKVIEPPVSGTETAYAVGDMTFIKAGLTQSRWGWIITVSAPGSYSAPIYAGAAQNNLSKGTLVGTLNYSYTGSSLSVTYTMLSGFRMEETHLYASPVFPFTIAPGQYGNIHDLSSASSDSYTLQVSGSPLYLIAHAVVSGF